MYKVYAGNLLLYSDTIENLKIFDAKMTLELNKTGSFSFTIYPDHPYYNRIYKLKTIISVYQDDYFLFRGRILNDNLGFRNEKNIECEGELAFFLDSIQRPYSYSGSISGFLDMLIKNHNSQVESEHEFKLGNVTVTDPNNTIVRSSIDYTNTWTVINEKLINILGGYISARHEDGLIYIDYLQDFNLLSSQKIEFAKNLLDLKRIRKGEGVATALIPLGAKLKDEQGQDTDERLTVKDVNDGKDYIVDSDAISQYGYIYATKTWDDVTQPQNLLTKANAYLADLKTASDTIELSAADLATIDSTVTSFHIGTYVKVISNPHGINQNMLVTKISINLMKPASNKLTLGGIVKPFTESLNFDVVKGADGINGKDGKDGKGISSIVNYYLATNASSGVTTSTSGWTKTVQSVTSSKKYLWNYEEITYTDNTNTSTTPCIIGAYGDKGSTGSAGKDAAIQSATEPSDKSYMWLDISVEPPLLKRWNGTEWEAINDTSGIVDSIDLLSSNMSTTIANTSDEILHSVSENYYLKGETDSLIESVSTELTQTKDSFEFRFNQFSQDIDSVKDGTDAQFQEFRKYIRFDDGNIILGESGNELTLKIQNDRISFLESGAEVAYFTNRKLYITDGEFLNSLQLGRFAFMPRTNGNLSFKKII